MAADLARLQSPSAVQSALDEFSSLGRAGFLAQYRYGKSRDFLVRSPASGELCDSKPTVGAAFGFQYPSEGPLKPSDFSGGEATVAPKLQSLGFEVIRVGEDWSQQFRAVLVDAPAIELVAKLQSVAPRIRLPRKSDFAARDEANRLLGRNGEQWVLGFEQQGLQDAGRAELFQRVEWISDVRGDGAGYDILSYDATDQPRYIEVKTTNGAHTAAFIISRNELEFSQESGTRFILTAYFNSARH